MTPEENEILWKLYEDHVIHGRHHETLRATTTTVLLAIAAGVLGLLGVERVWPPDLRVLPLALFLVILGLFGALFTAKYHERFTFHMNRAREYRNALDASLPAVGINKFRPIADARTKSEYPRLFHLRLWLFWVGLYVLVAALGLVLSVLILWFHYVHRISPPISRMQAHDLVFAQITDPHMFDDGPDPKEKSNINQPELTNKARDEDARAFDWAIGQINRLNASGASNTHIQFVAMTGDFGLEMVDFSSLKQLKDSGRLPRFCQNQKDVPNNGKISTFTAIQASQRVAAQLAPIRVNTVYLVPGNNDLVAENIEDQLRFRCFVGLVQEQVNKIRSEPLALVELDTTPILLPSAAFEQHGIWLLGLNSASLKNRDNYRACSNPAAMNSELARSACPEPQMSALKEWSDENPNAVALVFTHIPDLRDPFAVRQAKDWNQVPSALVLDNKAHQDWLAFARSPQVLAIFAGHFHDPDRAVYHPDLNDSSKAEFWGRLSVDPQITNKTWLAPPLAEKYQTGWYEQARGIALVRLQGKNVVVKKCWYPEICSIAP